ncbi:hypothetical protein HanXRQr2_Chr13g0610661 [Helianthus annuus]|uniref:Disease resistance N-terminal domain-containing protein n=1 Tax=Helianthus annuus TaxID=4232 RepID=A0A251SX44_HELAN|nr:hypothetical protein HanXRQr2_Chr13g0610661 [Helianthus annuus]
MAEIVLSAFLNVLFEKLASAALKTIASYKGIDAEIKKWHRSLKQIQRVLADASRKEITDDAVKEWLNDLQHLAYDIDDVLDDLATEAMHREFNHEPEAIASKALESRPRIVRVKNIEWRTQNQAVVSTDFDCSSSFSDESSREQNLGVDWKFFVELRLLKTEIYLCLF